MFKLIVALCLLGVSYGAVGGWTNLETNSVTITELVDVALAHINGEEVDGLYYRGLVEVKSAKQQVVNGIKYEVTIITGQTHCAKADAGAKLCEIPANTAQQECVFQFWKEPAAESPTLLSQSCTDL